MLVSRLERLIEDYRTRAWLGDFLAFAAKENLFATFLTPSSVAGEGEPDKRWETARIAALNEILGFCGLDHWYAWQVTILGLGPVWQSDNAAALVSVFGRRTDVEGPGGYVFFAADSRHPAYHLVKNVVDSSKFNLCTASIGICEHAMYEAVTHAHNRLLYGRSVTSFPHVRRELTDAYVRLVDMKSFSDRAVDYFRSAGPDDRRYLVFNPMTKMKVTTEGEKVLGPETRPLDPRGRWVARHQ